MSIRLGAGGGSGSGASDDLTFGGNELASVFGSPSLVTLGRFKVWSCGNASSSRLGGTVYIPDGWAGFDVELWWANGGAGAGNVALNLATYRQLDAGDDLSLAGGGDVLNGTVQTIAAGTQNLLAITTLATGIAMPGQHVQFAVSREIGGTDTLANAIYIERVVIKKTV